MKENSTLQKSDFSQFLSKNNISNLDVNKYLFSNSNPKNKSLFKTKDVSRIENLLND